MVVLAMVIGTNTSPALAKGPLLETTTDSGALFEPFDGSVHINANIRHNQPDGRVSVYRCVSGNTGSDGCIWIHDFAQNIRAQLYALANTYCSSQYVDFVYLSGSVFDATETLRCRG